MQHRGYRSSRHGRLAISIVVALSLGCAAKSRSREVNPAVQKDLAVDANQVRLRMRSLVDPLAGEIERTADQIAVATPDATIKRAAIRWKIEGVPALRASLFQPDPFTAVLDTWVLTYQMAEYFESGPGRTMLGSSAPLAVETCRRLEEDFAKVVATFTISRDVSNVRAFARQWATEHPIRYAIQDRETTLSRVEDRDLGVSWSIGEAVAEMTTTADDLRREIEVYSDHFFRQARWETELLKVDLRGEDALPLAERAVNSSERAVVTLDRLAPAIAGAAEAASTAPLLIAAERKSVTDALHEDLTRMLSFLRGERVAGLQHLSEERHVALKELREMAASERLAISREIELAGVRLVDHAAWRVAQLLIATLALVFVAATLFLILARRHSPGWTEHERRKRWA